MGMQLLGGLSAKKFLSEFWQKQPLIVRNAIPDFNGLIQAPELFRLAARADVESRVVQRRGARWRLVDGPFSRKEFSRLPASGWTILVHGLNLVHPDADALLRRFDFIPYARLDDVMVSYAVTGGGVGPHVDSYDVFLLQGPGRRRWRLSGRGRHKFDPRAPLKILESFRPEQEWLLGPGDMLYLPPGYAHEGTAIEPCFTYSIGFRALSRREMATEFLASLQEHFQLEGLYTDPGLRAPRNPAEIPAGMIAAAEQAIRSARWKRGDVARFLGRYLTAPKPRVEFPAPRRMPTEEAFIRRCRTRGVRLDTRTQLLFRGADFFINGESFRPRREHRPWLEELARRRSQPPERRMPGGLCSLLNRWYLSGWIQPGQRE